MDTLAVRLYTSSLPRRVRDFHPLERAHGAQTKLKTLDLQGFFSGDDGIRTHVPVARQLDFESSSLWPLRYVSSVVDLVIIPV